MVPLAVLSLSCVDNPTAMESFSAAQAYTTTSSSDYFSFLSPLDKSGTTAGAPFNPGLNTFVEVCRVDGAACDVIVRFVPAPGGEPSTGVVVDEVNELYQVNWKLSDTPLVAGHTYRVTVRTAPSDQQGGREFGHIDVLVDESGAKIYDPDTGSLVNSYNMTQTVPIKYRIEVGALCRTAQSDSSAEPCLETTVDSDGGTFVVESQLAGVMFPAGAISQSVNLIIERYEPSDDSEECLPTTMPQYTGCYTYRTEPVVESFSVEVVVGVCPDPAALPILEQLDLWKWSETNQTLDALPRRDVEFLNCPEVAPSSSGSVLSLSHRMIRPVARLLLPAPVYARTLSPYGGGLLAFSRIGWVRPLQLTVVQGDGETAVTGSAVDPQPVVRVTAAGEQVGDLAVPVGVAGVPVTFQPGTAGGSAAPSSTVTDEDGYASTAWTLGETAGTYTLDVTASNPLSGWPNRSGVWSALVLNATAVEPALPVTSYAVTFRSPVVKGSGGGGTIGGLPVSVQVCKLNGQGACLAGQTTVLQGADIMRKERFYQTSWSSGSKDKGSYLLTVFIDGVPADSILMETASKTATAEYVFNPGQNVEIKFSIAVR